MRRPTLIISILLLSLSLISPTQTFAANTDNDLLKIYQDRRSGNQMNLETWYGGKYGGSAEESIGFGDIILLDLMEKVGGSSSDNADKLYQELNGLLSSSSTQPNITSSLFQEGAIQGTAKIITSLYQTTPASSTEYLAYVQNNLQNKKVVQSVYADNGYGFTSLQPILSVWKAFRNVAYFFFVLGFILYGFMIMFRIKINPQTAITIQLALPKLIITLLLITFSYAIAGFMIDLFYLTWGILTNLLISQGLAPKWSNFVSGYSVGLGVPMIGGMIASVKFFINDLWSILLPIPQSVAAIATLLVTILSSGLYMILGLILLIAVLFTFMKVLWMLIKSYVNIILNIIFSPIILLGNIIPGSKSFGNWIKNILSELSVFISVMTMYLLSFHFMWQFENLNPESGAMWVPPPLLGQGFSNWGLGTNSASALSLLGLGMILMTPKIAEIIKNALQIKDLGYGSAIGEAFAPFKIIADPIIKKQQQRFGNLSTPVINRATTKLKAPYTKKTPPPPTTPVGKPKSPRKSANPYRPTSHKS